MGDVRKFSAWSFLRNVLMQGRDIHLDHVGKGYESYSARVDEAASEREQELERAIAARGAVPEGWVLVPVKPTKFMMDAAIPPGRQDQTGRREFAIWSAMLAAAPQPAGECCDTPACCFRDAYVGAREDLSDWKGRAQRAEAELRRLGYAGIDASVPPSQPAGEDGPSVYVECRQCDECEHVGINDEHDADAACHDCEWHGPAPVEDKCPGCGRDGTMTAACPKCSGRYTTLAVTEIPAPPEPAPSAPVPRAMPEGFVLVPREPTPNMIESSTGGQNFRTANCETLGDERDLLRRQWSAMLAAAPQPAGEAVPRPDLVPGVMRCAKCAFQLHRVTLYVRSGTTGAGDSETEPCPNGCGPLWPVTWRQWAEEAQEYAQRLRAELDALKTEPALSAPADINSPPEFPDNCVDSLAPADVEALADESGKRYNNGAYWYFNRQALHDFARRLSGAQQAECTMRHQCDCVGACKYGRGGNGAQQAAKDDA